MPDSRNYPVGSSVKEMSKGTMTTRFILIGAVALLSIACGSASNTASTKADASTTTSPGVDDSTTVKPPPKAPDVDLNAMPDWFQDGDTAPDGLVDTIAGNLGATYAGSMSVNWPTGGLGCGTGGAELQVVTPGYVIFYQSETSLIRVHAGENGRWLVCALGEPLRGIPVLNS